MMVYVSAGILGLLCLIAFMVLCVIRLWRNIRANRKLSLLYIGAMALVAAGAVSAVLDEGLFFQNNPHTTMFWLALGILMLDSLAPATLPESSNE
jgi:O-antigen ligase